MPNRSPASLKSSLLRLVVIPAFFLILMLAGVITFSGSIVYGDIQNEQILVVKTIARFGDQYLSETRILLNNSSAVILTLPLLDRAHILSHMYTNYPRFTALYLLDPAGVVLSEQTADAAQSVVGFDFSRETYFQIVKNTKQAYFSSTFFSLSSDDVAVIVAQPILEDEMLSGVLVGELNLINLQETIQRMSIRDSDTVFIVDERGTVVAHPDRNLVRQQVNLGDNAVIRAGYSDASTEILMMDSAWVIASAAPMMNGWVVITTRPVWQAVQPLLLLLGVSAIVSLLSIAAFAIGIQRSLKQISAPITRLAEKAGDISQGNYVPLGNTEIFGKYRELLTLADSFDRMLATIEARTSELVDINEKLGQELDERHRIETELRKSEARYRGLFEDSPVAIWEEDFSGAKHLLDNYKPKYQDNWELFLSQNPEILRECADKVRVISVNRAAQVLYGARTQDKMLGTLSEIFLSRVPQSFTKELEALWHERSGIELESTIEIYAGEFRHVIIQWSVLPDHQKAYDRVLILLVDITARKQAEMEIKKHRERLEELVEERTVELKQANRELESFAYTVSHDLRAPLRHIDGFTGILLTDYSEMLDEQGRKFLSNIRQGSQNMANMIDGLLQLSRTSRGDLHYIEVNLSDIAVEVSQELQETEPERLTIWTIEPGGIVTGDERLLRAALQNLLHNAWKFTSHNPKPCIEFGVLRKPLNLDNFNGKPPIFYVRDNGVGFDMQYAAKLFTPFQRLHKDDEFAGTGIGLATVQRIIQRHGGKIGCESKQGEGTVFYFTVS